MFKIVSLNLVFLISFSASQTIHYNQEFEINTYKEKWQQYPCVSGLNNGDFVVTWESYNQDGSDFGIFGQNFSRSGSKIGSEFQINSYTNSGQTNPKICSLKDSGFAVCWQSNGQDGDSYGIYCQIYNLDGSKRNQEFRANTYTDMAQINPCLCGLENGYFVISWESSWQDSSYSGIYGQLFDGNGYKYGQEFRINTTTRGHQSNPSTISLMDSGFVVCWNSNNYQNDNEYDIYGQIFKNDGTKLGSEFRVNDTTIGDQVNSSIGRLNNGGFVICWESREQEDINKDDIYGQIFDCNGLKVDTEFKINTYTAWYQLSPAVCGVSTGKFIVCWRSIGQDGSSSGIYSQLFNDEGTKLGSEFLTNSYVKDGQNYPCVANIADSEYVICWQSEKQDGSYVSIFGKYYLIEPLIHTLDTFSLIIPGDDEIVDSSQIRFKWESASNMDINYPWEMRYFLYIDDNIDFSYPRDIGPIKDTSYIDENLKAGTTYFWKVLAKNIAGDSLWASETFVFKVSEEATNIEYQEFGNPEIFQLYPNHPNPFNPETTIKYNLPTDQALYQVKIKIYNALGQLVTTLINKPQNPGLHTVKWDGKNTAGQKMPSGIYFCVVEAGQFKSTKKMLLVR